MSRPRGRPAAGTGVTRAQVIDAALALLAERGGEGLSMRAVAARLGVSAMSLYRHVADHTGLLVALSDRVYAQVLRDAGASGDERANIRDLLARYHEAVGRHPQLTLAIFAQPQAFSGLTRQITERLTFLLARLTPDFLLWRDILIDHAHGSALALTAARGDAAQSQAMRLEYERALDCLLKGIASP